MVMPKKHDCEALRRCSALARAMQEGGSCALVHFVAQDNAAPRLGCLTPLLGEPSLLPSAPISGSCVGLQGSNGLAATPEPHASGLTGELVHAGPSVNRV